MSLFTKETIKRLRKDIREKYPEMEEKEFEARFQEALKQYKFEFEKKIEKVFSNHTFKPEEGED